LSSEQINEFRLRYRDDFICFIEQAFNIIGETNDDDFLKKREEIIYHVSSKLKAIEKQLEIRIGSLTSLLPALGKAVSPSIEYLLEERGGTVGKKLHRALRLPTIPIKRSDRWAYHFLKEESDFIIRKN